MLSLLLIIHICIYNLQPKLNGDFTDISNYGNSISTLKYINSLKDFEIRNIYYPLKNFHSINYQSNVEQDVLFATNADCDLYIDGVLKATISKKGHKYLKLSPGKYVYKVKTAAIPDELEETFMVKEDQPNEIFIDLLYFLDERIKMRELLRGNETKAVTTSNTSSKNSIPSNANATNVVSEKEIIKVFETNMISITGGSFIMGNSKASAQDETEHTVTVSSIRFSKYEVTQKQWEVIMGYNPSENKGCDNCPVENVSWEEVMKFIKKLNVSTGKKFRLPSEAEWEYVAKKGGKEEIDEAGGIESYIKKTAWYYGNADKKTHPIGLKQPNSSGVYDLLGNVSEWCSDWYSTNYFKEENQKDPEGPPLGKEKVIRGANFEDYSGDRFRPSLRGKLKPTGKYKTLGFRLVMDM